VKDTVRSRFQLQRASGQEPGYGPTCFLDAVPSPAAMRMRRSRERRREGLRCIRVELRETEISALVRIGLLERDARNNRIAVLKALYGFLERELDSGS
jgi:hypothetical protein